MGGWDGEREGEEWERKGGREEERREGMRGEGRNLKRRAREESE